MSTPAHLPALLYCILHSHFVLRYNRCKVPLSVVLQPLNDAPGCNVGWTEFPTGAPVRCTGCKGYINASVKWRDGGREWICNLCGLPNVVNRCPLRSLQPHEALTGSSSTGNTTPCSITLAAALMLRLDRSYLSVPTSLLLLKAMPTRPLRAWTLLMYHSEFDCARRYPSVLFLIDVSHQAVSSGFSDAVIQSVRQCISDMQYLKTRVGIAMYAC